MKKHLNVAILILFLVFTGTVTLLVTEEACMAKEFDASLNVMGYDRDVTIKINGIHISKITGGQSHAVRLFLAE